MHELFKDPKFWSSWSICMEKLQEIADEEINSFDIPETLKKLLKSQVEGIAQRILSWTSDSYDRNEPDYFRTSEKLCWTAWGTLDLRKTATKVFNKEPIVVRIELNI